MTSAREAVLARIALAHTHAPPPDLPYAAIERNYRTARTSDAADPDQLVDLLVDRLTDYRANVRRCSVGELPQTIAVALAEHGVQRLVVPAGLDQEWLAATTVEQLVDRPDARLTVDELDGADGVLTGCSLAVAETGTLILDAGPGQGRRALTLVPDYHLCVVLPTALCPDVPHAVARLELDRPITMISGPSATSDIELNRVEGVHGPRTLDVIVVW